MFVVSQKNRTYALELLRVAAPIIGVTISRMLMGFIDFVMVSTLGTSAQAAISPATIFVFAFATLGMGAAQSVQTFVSQAEGRGEARQAGAYAWQSAYIAAFIAMLIAPLAVLTPQWFPAIAGLGNADPAVVALEVLYVQVALWSVGPAVLASGLESFFNGIQRAQITLKATLVSVAVNAIGNYLLIFGAFGFPEMGIAGAATATVLGWLARVVVLVGAMRRSEFVRDYGTNVGFAPDRAKLRGIIVLGGPIALQWLVDIGAWVVFLNIIIPGFGTAAWAATNIGIQCMHLAFMPAIGLGIALCSQVGFAIGAGRNFEAYDRSRVALWMAGAYMGAIGLVFALGGRWLVSVFNNHDEDVISAGALILVWAAVFQVFDAMCIVYINALRGAGDTRIPAIVVGIACWVIFIGGGLLVGRLAPQLSYNGPWMTCTIYIILLGVYLRARFRGGAWERIRVPGAAPTPMSGQTESIAKETDGADPPGVESSGVAAAPSAMGHGAS